jgi:ornithine cyclodeaminase
MSEAPRYVGREAIAEFGYAAAANALEDALAAGLDPEGQPERTGLRVGDGELLVMPGLGPGHAAVKLVTVSDRAPRIKGTCVLFDNETLAPVIFDGGALTLLRTAALSALAVRRLAVPGARRLVVIGRGPQGKAHVDAIRAVCPIEQTELLGRDDAYADAVAAADVVCCCTSASRPLFDGDLVAEHACVVAIGSHLPDAREIDDRLDSRAAALREAGDVIGAIRNGALDAGELVTLAEIVTGAVEVRTGPWLFKSVGMGWQDAVVAEAVLARTG